MLEQLETQAISWPQKAQGIKIIDQGTYDHAVTLLKDLGALEAEIKAHHAPVKDAAFKAHRAAVAAEKRLLDPVEAARGILRGSIGVWMVDQERLRRDIQAVTEAAAKKMADEMALAAAVQAEEQGASIEEVSTILEEQPFIPSVVAAPTFQRQAGVSSRQTWRAEVFDIKALCLAVGNGRVSPNYVTPNMVALNAVARAEKGSLLLAGVRAVEEIGITVRR